MSLTLLRPARTARRLRRDLREQPLVRNAVHLMTGTVLQATLGAVFWIVAARQFPTSIVGVDSALITAMMTLSIICQLNMGTALLRFLPQLGPRSAHWILGAYGIAAGTGLVLAGVFALLAPLVAPDLDTLHDVTTALGFVLIVAGWTVFTLQDAALIGMRHSGWVALEGLAFGVLKLVVLVLLSQTSMRHGVLLAWVAPLVVLIPAINLLLFRRLIPAHALRAAAPGSLLRSPRAILVKFVGQDYVGVLLSQAALAALPLIVIAILGDQANAYFYVAFTLATMLDVLVFNAVMSLIVEASNAEHDLERLARMAVRRLVLPLVVVAGIIVVAAPVLLLPFGQAYSDEGTSVLRLLALALPFRAIVFVFDAACRIRGQGLRIMLTQSSGFILLVPLAVVLAPTLGLPGIGIAWLACAITVALCVAPLLTGALRDPIGATA